MSTKADDFMREWAEKGALPIEEQLRATGSLEDIDLELLGKALTKENCTTWILLVGPMLAMMTAFVMGLQWQKYKEESESPINDLLDGIKGL